MFCSNLLGLRNYCPVMLWLQLHNVFRNDCALCQMIVMGKPNLAKVGSDLLGGKVKKCLGWHKESGKIDLILLHLVRRYK